MRGERRRRFSCEKKMHPSEQSTTGSSSYFSTLLQETRVFCRVRSCILYLDKHKTPRTCTKRPPHHTTSWPRKWTNVLAVSLLSPIAIGQVVSAKFVCCGDRCRRKRVRQVVYTRVLVSANLVRRRGRRRIFFADDITFLPAKN